ncbi:MAG TPA: ANTAR domain-containing protein [Mycobacteriales bacterium]|nr:ANTAR domain-containing protein [Mycobacteriales bacterium]
MGRSIEHDPGGSQLARAETLLAAAQGMISALAYLSRQLEQEVRTIANAAAEQGPGGTMLSKLTAENAQLREALNGRGVIERAKGMLMVACDCDEDTAFRLLVDLSRQKRRKVREVAAELVSDRALWPQPPTGPSSRPGLSVVGRVERNRSRTRPDGEPVPG